MWRWPGLKGGKRSRGFAGKEGTWNSPESGPEERFRQPVLAYSRGASGKVPRHPLPFPPAAFVVLSHAWLSHTWRRFHVALSQPASHAASAGPGPPAPG